MGRSGKNLDTLTSWIETCLHNGIIDYFYISLHPDHKLSPGSEIIISILTRKAFHSFNIKSTSEDVYACVPLKSIEWITEFQPPDKDSYVVQLFIPKTVMTISDVITRKDGLQDFSNMIKRAIERLE